MRKNRHLVPCRNWHELLQIADDMHKAVRNAAWERYDGGWKPNLRGPTLNMIDAIARYEIWRIENNV